MINTALVQVRVDEALKDEVTNKKIFGNILERQRYLREKQSKICRK